MGLLETFGKLMSDQGVSSILRERLELVRDQIETVQAKAEALEEKNKLVTDERDRLKIKVEQLEKELSMLGPAPEFVMKNGVLWRPEGNGFEDFPYCPECEEVTRPSPPIGQLMNWVCSCCNRTFPRVKKPETSEVGQ